VHSALRMKDRMRKPALVASIRHRVCKTRETCVAFQPYQSERCRRRCCSFTAATSNIALHRQPSERSNAHHAAPDPGASATTDAVSFLQSRGYLAWCRRAGSRTMAILYLCCRGRWQVLDMLVYCWDGRRVQSVARPARGAAMVRSAMSQPSNPVGPGDMTPSAGSTQQLNFEPFQEVSHASGPAALAGARVFNSL
jgi:hypothetical protein